MSDQEYFTEEERKDLREKTAQLQNDPTPKLTGLDPIRYIPVTDIDNPFTEEERADTRSRPGNPLGAMAAFGMGKIPVSYTHLTLPTKRIV